MYPRFTSASVQGRPSRLVRNSVRCATSSGAERIFFVTPRIASAVTVQREYRGPLALGAFRHEHARGDLIRRRGLNLDDFDCEVSALLAADEFGGERHRLRVITQPFVQHRTRRRLPRGEVFPLRVEEREPRRVFAREPFHHRVKVGQVGQHG